MISLFPLQINGRIFAFLDFHGHSRKNDVFCYGGIYNWKNIRAQNSKFQGSTIKALQSLNTCSSVEKIEKNCFTSPMSFSVMENYGSNASNVEISSLRHELYPLIFPYLLNKSHPKYFAIRKCRFGMLFVSININISKSFSHDHTCVLFKTLSPFSFYFGYRQSNRLLV